MTTLEYRFKQGKAACKQCSRSEQATLGETDRDPIALFKASSQGRLRARSEGDFAADHRP